MAAQPYAKLVWSVGIAMGGIAIGFCVGRHCAAVESAMSVGERAPTLTRDSAGNERTQSPEPGSQIQSGDTQTDSLSQRWASLRGHPATPDVEEQMRRCLLELGAQDFDAALKLSQSAPTPRQRELFRNAALQGWSTRDPESAGKWVLSHVRSQERRSAVEALAAGAVVRPEEAIRAFKALIADDPLLASDHGNALAGAFAHSGQFTIASDFATTGPDQYRAAWLANVYHSWGVCQPEAALSRLNTISDPGARREAMSGLFAGWGSSDPAGLVAYAQKLPLGESRVEALKEGLTQWVYRDSAAASDWMDKIDPSPDLDAGAAALAVMPALVERKPDVAASWAESITDPELRENTLLDLIRLWSEHDAIGARKYVNASPALGPQSRALALSILQPRE